jgi:hypothetical protein
MIGEILQEAESQLREMARMAENYHSIARSCALLDAIKVLKTAERTVLERHLKMSNAAGLLSAKDDVPFHSE